MTIRKMMAFFNEDIMYLKLKAIYQIEEKIRYKEGTKTLKSFKITSL